MSQINLIFGHFQSDALSTELQNLIPIPWAQWTSILPHVTMWVDKVRDFRKHCALSYASSLSDVISLFPPEFTKMLCPPFLLWLWTLCIYLKPVTVQSILPLNQEWLGNKDLPIRSCLPLVLPFLWTACAGTVHTGALRRRPAWWGAAQDLGERLQR